MNRTVLLLALAAMLAISALADETKPDLVSPKPAANRLIRVLLFVPGSERLIDYPDVSQVLHCDRDRITFETQDGVVITHQGPFTVIQPKSVFSESNSNPRGVHFFDAR